MRRLLLTVGGVLAATAAHAATIYVDGNIASTSCTNYSAAARACGTGSATAYKTPAGAAAVVNPGDVVEIRGGTYSIAADSVTRLSRSGSAASPIRFRGYDGERVIFKGPYDVDSDGDGIRNWDESSGGDAAGPQSGDRGAGLAISGNYNIVSRIRIEWTYQCMEVTGNNNVIEEVVAADCWEGGFGIQDGDNNVVKYSAGFRQRHRSGAGIAPSSASSITSGNVLFRNLFFNNGRQLPNGAKVSPFQGDPNGGGNSDGFGTSKECSDEVNGAYSLCRAITFQENIAWRNADDCYDTSMAGSWVIGNIGYDCGPNGMTGWKMLRDQYENTFSGNLFVGASNASSLNWGMRFRFADTSTTSYVLHNMATGVVDQFGIGVLSLTSGARCIARNNLAWGNPTEFSWNGCTNSNNYSGDALGVPLVALAGFNAAVAVQAAENCLASAPGTVTVRSCWQTLYNSFYNAYRLTTVATAVDAGVAVSGYHCALADDRGQNPDAACRHWNGSAPDQGPFELGIVGNPDKTRCSVVGECSSLGGGGGEDPPIVPPSAPTSLRIIR
jgi:hypothetical protein